MQTLLRKPGFFPIDQWGLLYPKYSKVPIRTGPIIRTVLIFLGTLQL